MDKSGVSVSIGIVVAALTLAWTWRDIASHSSAPAMPLEEPTKAIAPAATLHAYQLLGTSIASMVWRLDTVTGDLSFCNLSNITMGQTDFSKSHVACIGELTAHPMVDK